MSSALSTIAARLPPPVRRRANATWVSASYVRRVAGPWTAARGGRRVVLVFDTLTAPPSFGDYFLFTMLGRLFAALGRHSEIVVVEGDVRADFREVAEAFRYKFEEFEEMTRAVALERGPGFQRMAFEDLAAWRDALPGGAACYPDQETQDARGMTYNFSWNTLEHALRRLPEAQRGRVVLDGPALAAATGVEPPAEPYVLLAARAASALGGERDVAREDVVRQLELIDAAFPGILIVIASDRFGSDQIRTWDLGGNVVLATDIAKGFIKHGALALNARCYVQIRGGGLSLVPLFSRTPAFFASDPSNETTPWAAAIESPDGYRLPWAHPLTVWASQHGAVEQRLERFLAEVAGR